MRGIVTGDFHYGLSVEDLDRTPEVHKAVNKIVDYAIENKVDFFSIGGDTTDNNTPHPDHLRMIIEILNRLDDAEIVTFVMRGNHEAVADKERLWGLTPLEEIGYANVHFIKEPKILSLEDMVFLFLPHVTQNQASQSKYKGSPQALIEAEAERLLGTVTNKKITVISHYNHIGVLPGTEHIRLRQSDLNIPAVVTRSPKVIKVFNSHIHNPNEKQKVVMPGSVICTAFGDLTAKRFLDITYRDNADRWDIKSVPTQMFPLVELTFDFTKLLPEERFSVLEEEAEKLSKDTILRVRCLVNEEILPELNFNAMKEVFIPKVKFVKSFNRIIARKRSVRDTEQKANLNPLDAVQRYLYQRKPDGLERKLLLAKAIITEGQEAELESVAHFENPIAANDKLEESVEELFEEDTPVADVSDLDTDFDLSDLEI